ncbi:FHA domain-containing protein [Agrococcus sp. SGAir0287]|uniref:FHA domain-containing protein n=1 Tax=Agrococcus sp. SGAir0287 TaxID=2070347 RepID=UPI0015866C5B|nr:FHA domain-containing protein [Agrococcus sp. SGAir0287]
MRTTYVSGAAWCIVHGDVLVVLDRGFDARSASALFARLDPAALRDEPLALAVLEPTADGWLLSRRRGVPAVTYAALPDRSGEAWGSDLLPAGATVAFGAVGALDEAMPLAGGVVRASAVRVELAAPRSADRPVADAASARPEAQPVDAPASLEAPPIVEHAPVPSPAATPVPSAPEAPVVVEHAPVQDADTTATPVPDDGEEPEAPPPASDAAALEPVVEHALAAPDEESRAEPTPDAPSGIGGIIDSVPGFIRPATVVEVPDDLAMGDHDGMTIAGDEARRLAAAARAEQAAPPVLGPATGPVVLSTLCASGHVNPPGAGACACGAPIVSDSADQRARPEFAELVLPDGGRVPLGRGVVLGRRPRSRRVEDGRVPRLVTVHSPSEDISRSHLEVRCEDWNVLAIDLESTNGTVLLRDGAAPMRLRPDVPQLVAFGDRLDLGDGVVVRVERARTEAGS